MRSGTELPLALPLLVAASALVFLDLPGRLILDWVDPRTLIEEGEREGSLLGQWVPQPTQPTEAAGPVEGRAQRRSVTGAALRGLRLSRGNGRTPSSNSRSPPQFPLNYSFITTLNLKHFTKQQLYYLQSQSLFQISAIKVRCFYFILKTVNCWTQNYLRPHSTEAKRKDFVASMSWGIVGRTVEGAIVCKVLAILPGGIGNMQISNSTLPVSRVK